jgi:hypothetical protein
LDKKQFLEEFADMLGMSAADFLHFAGVWIIGF